MGQLTERRNSLLGQFNQEKISLFESESESVRIVTGFDRVACSGQANETIAVSGEMVPRSRPGFCRPRVWLRAATEMGFPIKSFPILPLDSFSTAESCSLSQQRC